MIVLMIPPVLPLLPPVFPPSRNMRSPTLWALPQNFRRQARCLRSRTVASELKLTRVLLPTFPLTEGLRGAHRALRTRGLRPLDHSGYCVVRLQRSYLGSRMFPNEHPENFIS